MALIDVGGVGYEVEVPTGVRAALPPLGEELTLHTHFLVREDAQLLYGFANPSERDVFRALLRISGVGAKLALSVLSTFALDELALAAEDGDVTRLTRVPGIGRKTAARMLVDLKDRLGGFNLSLERASAPAHAASEEARQGLISLGYRSQEAVRMVAVVNGEALTAEDIIREALRQAGSQRSGAA